MIHHLKALKQPIASESKETVNSCEPSSFLSSETVQETNLENGSVYSLTGSSTIKESHGGQECKRVVPAWRVREAITWSFERPLYEAVMVKHGLP